MIFIFPLSYNNYSTMPQRPHHCFKEDNGPGSSEGPGLEPGSDLMFLSQPTALPRRPNPQPSPPALEGDGEAASSNSDSGLGVVGVGGGVRGVGPELLYVSQ